MEPPSLQNHLHHTAKRRPTFAVAVAFAVGQHTRDFTPCLISSPYSDSRVIMNMRSPSPDLVPGNHLNKCLLRYARTGRMPGNTRAHLDVPSGGPPKSSGGPAPEPSSLWAGSAARLQLLPLKSL